MISSIFAWFALRGISAEQLKAGLIITALLASIVAVVVWFDRHDAGVIEQHEAGTELKIERSGRAADAKMSQRVERDEAAIVEARKEFEDATATLPPSGLTRRQRIDICLELRDAGTDTTVIPECRDLHTGGEASPVAHYPPGRQ